MSIAIETIQVLEEIVKDIPIGTNLALLHLLWAMVSGAFLQSRGALFGALQVAGFSARQIRRCSQAVRCGAWKMEDLIQSWQNYLLTQEDLEVRRYGGYTPLAADITAFFRPKLKGKIGKFFHHIANKAIKGIGIGLIVMVGEVEGRRIPLIREILPAEGDMSQAQLKRELLTLVSSCLKEDEVAVYDGGASIGDMQNAKVERYVVRLPINCTARRNYLPPQERGRPREYGEIVRPIARSYKGRILPSTSPSLQGEFSFEGRKIKCSGWKDLLRNDQKVSEAEESFNIWVFHDPLYRTPLVLGTNMDVEPKVIFQLYHDRWVVEEVPLVAKQLLGLARGFLFSTKGRVRLPQLALLAANILSYLACVFPPLPTGFWDRKPKRTPGRLRRVLAREGFSKDYPLDGRIRKKESVTYHLPKGVKAHRRKRAA